METGSDDSVLALLFYNPAWDKQIIISDDDQPWDGFTALHWWARRTWELSSFINTWEKELPKVKCRIYGEDRAFTWLVVSVVSLP